MRHILYAIGTIVLLAAGFATAGLATTTGEGEGHTPVTICHMPGTPAEMTLVVDDDAVPGHLGHGDYLGACNNMPPDACPTLDGYQYDDEDCPPPTDTNPPPPGDDTTPTTPPSGPRCPPGMVPTAGKDGTSGNQECELPKPPSSSGTFTVPPPAAPTVTTTTTITNTVTVPSPPKVITKTKIKTRVKTRVIVRHHTKVVKKIVIKKVPGKCPVGTRAYKGSCHAMVKGSG